MYRRRVYVSVALALVAVLAFNSVAFAAGSASHEVHLIGKVLNVNMAAQTFKLITNKGEQSTIHVDQDTVFKGNVKSLAGFKDGMAVNVHAALLPDGTRLATQISVHKFSTKAKISGTVTQKNAALMTFSIKGQDGKMYNFHVRNSTKFGGENGKASWSKLAINMSVNVTYDVMAEGLLVAIKVQVK